MSDRKHYCPSNGTEGSLFFAQCTGCKHDLRDNHDTNLCAIGIGSRVFMSGWGEHNEFRSDELEHPPWPARCLKRVDVDAIVADFHEVTP